MAYSCVLAIHRRNCKEKAPLANPRSGNLLTFSPSGWRLQVQTNSNSIGLSDNWVNVPNSIATNQMTFAVDPSAGCVFYRLLYP